MQLTIGTRLGPYEIIAPLGAGGMGEVYRGRDTRLGRSVAIKIIALDSSGDSNIHVRFEHEARALSNIHHPHICALYDIGEIPGIGSTNQPLRFIVMEYLEGETLEQRLKRGPLRMEEVFRYGLEVADALDKAHRTHILHRDLKPSNIMVTKTGTRLFDFGLAKFVDSPADDFSAPTSTAPTSPKSITAEGSMIGTLEYMAPEQLKGGQPDVRTDIFSFGVCLYQMITGRRPFEGNSRAAVVAAILDQDPPPISKYRPEAPARLQWLVSNCTAKDADDRLQTAHDVKLELGRIAEEMRPEAVAPSQSTIRRRALYASVIAAAAIVAIGGFLWVRSALRTEPQKSAIKRFSISLPSAAPVATGAFEKLAVSPDGTKLVYVGGNAVTSLYLYSLDTLETKLLPQTEGATDPFFSPDGQWVGFYSAAREIKKIDLVQASTALLASNRDLRGATWGPDDAIVFAEPRSPLRRVSGLGGGVENVTPYDPNAEIRWPAFLPGGKSVLYTVSDFSGDYENARLVTTDLQTGETKVVLNRATHGRYVAGGYLAYFHSQALFLVPFDLRRLRTTGSPMPIANGIESFFSSGLAEFAVSGEGSLFYLPRSSQSGGELAWVDRSGNTTPVSHSLGVYDNPKISPDGSHVLVRVGLPPRSDIWTYNIGRDTWTRLTTEATNLSPIWSPDGRQVAFSSNRNRAFELYTMPSDGSASPKQVTAWRSWDFPTSWSPDGKLIAVEEQYRATLADIYIAKASGGTRPVPFLATRFSEHEAVFSPDGHWIAYVSNESGRPEVYVQPYPPNGQKWLISSDGGAQPVWRRDGKELFYRNRNMIMAVPIHANSEFDADKPKVLFRGDYGPYYDITPDGKRFIMVKVAKATPQTQINAIIGLPQSIQ